MISSFISLIRSWVGIVALVAVATLAVIAFDRREAQEVTTVKANLHVVCQQVNAAGTELNRLSQDMERNRYALVRALDVAAGERGQSTKDRLEYARLLGKLDSPTVERPFIGLDCETLTGR